MRMLTQNQQLKAYTKATGKPQYYSKVQLLVMKLRPLRIKDHQWAKNAGNRAADEVNPQSKHAAGRKPIAKEQSRNKK